MLNYWTECLRQKFGIDAKLKCLDGEFDLNFMVTETSGQKYILKVMRADCASDLVDMQCAAIRSLEKEKLPTPKIISSLSGTDYVVFDDEKGIPRLVWMITALDGICYANIKPQSLNFIYDLGIKSGVLSSALTDFNHPYLDRDFKWNLMQSNWIKDHLNLIKCKLRRGILFEIIEQYEITLEYAQNLPHVAIHNDLNDYNVLATSSNLGGVKVSGIIDFGDMVRNPRICELAIAGAYAVLDRDDPMDALAKLVEGYHLIYPLKINELEMIYTFLRMRLAVSVINSTLMALENPKDPYVTISQAPAWRFLEQQLSEGMVLAKLRIACGFSITSNATQILTYLNEARGSFAPIFKCDLNDAPMGDLSVAGSAIPQNPFELILDEASTIGDEIDADYWLGYWGEPRLIYTSDAFQGGVYKTANRRTVHIGIDIFASSGHKVYAPLIGVVEALENRDNYLDYGGVVILRHETPDEDTFYTLYGHLDPEILHTLSIGQTINKGEVFCHLGAQNQNGGWAPHLHFQLALSIDEMGDNWPGVADPDQMDLWGALCPNPAALLNLLDTKTAYHPLNQTDILRGRQNHFGKNLKLSYDEPVMFLRGWGNYLFDQMGRTYLDAYNNVPHVGHSHPRIQAVVSKQLQLLNSNTRYLHPAQNKFVNLILAKMPADLNVCYFVNSGSEANELALRLARTATGGEDIITPDHGYHGNTNAALEVSAYKFNKPNGIGCKPWVHLVDVADDYRGKYRRDDPDRAIKYANLVDDAIAQIDMRGGKLAGFIAETFPSVGGQIIPPIGYLSAVYEKIRSSGGVCIADEVQTGLGRLGDYFYGFEQQGASPDIVVLGKPIGNGHPIGVVVTTNEIAAKFANGIEYFSTFGGSTLSCCIGAEVLKIVEDENLQKNALLKGKRLFEGLRKLQNHHSLIGDVRGFGLFVGVELITDEFLTPATEIASFIVNRMKQERILIGVEGPFDNILKIRPPLTISNNDIDCILQNLNNSLSEAALLTDELRNVI